MHRANFFVEGYRNRLMYTPGKVKQMSRGKTQWPLTTWTFFLAAMFLLPAPHSGHNSAISTTTPLSVIASSSFIPSAEWTERSSDSRINPASSYCARVGGIVTIHTHGNGHIYQLCQFTDNRVCEVWAMFRGDCPIGGVRITGLDTIAQYYCVWLGGETLAVPHATCTLPNGKVCDDDALYNGRCSAYKTPDH